ncbi:hypothetical protein ACP8HI_11960 [Paenibacillus sp. FA6]|uniref:hypothetical protein n=1 Tax=Paenibacillus sp. FA6 TaxID=3413029 RepID=UPI003F655468
MKDDQEQIQHYVNLFDDLFLASSKVIKYILWTLICLMVCFQITLHFPSLRTYVSSVYKLDGVPMTERDVNDW